MLTPIQRLPYLVSRPHHEQPNDLELVQRPSLRTKARAVVSEDSDLSENAHSYANMFADIRDQSEWWANRMRQFLGLEHVRDW